jgi:GntR family transcriptional regulator
MSVAEAELIFKKHWKPQNQVMSKYAQLVSVIQSSVKNKYLNPGSKLPTEMDFVNGAPFSLGTVQRAMRILVDQGVIERRQGVGTFVAASPRRIHEPQLCKVFNNEWDGFLEVFTEIIGREEIVGKGPWSRYLGDHLEKVMRIERILLVEKEMRAFTKFYFDPDRLEALQHISIEDLDGANFRELLDRETGFAVGSYDQNMRVETFDSKICKHLKCKTKTAGAVIEAIAYTDSRIPLYFQEIYVPPNNRTLFITGAQK